MLKTSLAILTGKIIFALTRLFKIGGGSAAPGLYALKIEPELIQKLSSGISKNIVITGTNGKTTTARLLSHFLISRNLKIIRNSTGSNLERGIASSLIAKATFFGGIKDADLGIWELDEAAFNKAVFKIKPQIIVFLNAFRDQLDRYGEVDAVTNNWKETINKINWDCAILANGGDTNTAWITHFREKNVYGFRVLGHMVVDESTKEIKTSQKSDFSAKVTKNKGLDGTELALNFQGKEEKIKFDLIFSSFP